MKIERWTARPDATEEPADAKARAGLMLRQAIVKQPLDPDTLADIRSRLPGEHHLPKRRLVLRFAIALALFLSGGGAVMSATVLRRWSPFRHVPAGAPTPTAPPVTRHRATTPPIEAPRPQTVIEPAPASSPASTRRPRDPRPTELDPPVQQAAPPAPGPSALAREAALVGAALRKLREQDDAQGALTLLDAHDGQFAAAGALADEVRTTRIEALLRLGRHPRALALLDAQSPRPTGRERELLAVRAELRADAGRCVEALADFDALLTDDGSDAVAERALYGRAACRARTGDAEGARADLRACIAGFPEGRFASRARAALER
jgi:hypothetical protein